MPSTVPKVDGLIPLDQLAIQFFLRTQEVVAILKDAEVAIVYLSVSRKRIPLADQAEATAAIARRFLQANEADSSQPIKTIDERFSAQEAEIGRIKQQLEKLLAQATGGATA